MEKCIQLLQPISMTQATLSSSLASCIRHPATDMISIGVLSILVVLAMSNFVFQPSFSSEIISLGNNGTARSNCNCVVFRMDDIQDYWLKSGQLAAMNQFISRNQSLTLGIIMDSIGNDTEIVNKVKEGSDSGLFELAVHGWNHTDYTKLSEEEQRKSLDDSNRKMIELFGNTSEIFIPPLNSFNNDTINAMEQVGMKILDANSSSFDELELKGHNESRAQSSLSIQSKDFFYMPSTITFKDYYQDQPIKNSIQNIFNNVTQSIATNGYAVIIIHPQDFVKIDANGSLTDALDENETNDLSRLIDLILSNNIPLGSFFEVTEKIEMKDEIIQSSNSTSQNILADQVGAPLFMGVTPNLISTAYNNCSGGWAVTADFSPSESDYDGRGFSQAVTIYGLDDANNTTIRTLNSEFLKAVEMEGWGLTKQGDYVGAWDGKFWGPSSAYLTYQGEPLVAGISAATDGNVISYGSNFTIPTLPSPWNTMTFTAVDIGSGIIGKQVNIYIGVGNNAEKEADRATQTETNTVCLLPTLDPPDPISTDGMGMLDSSMAEIYNRYGKYIYEKAIEIGVSPASSAAVLYVETSGRGFGEDGRMIIRFEPCIFYDMWGSDHPGEFSQYFVCDRPNDKFRQSPAENFAELHGDHFREWTAFDLARTLDEDAAMKSISMGLAQIMGFNYHAIGYSSANEMFNALSNSTMSQLDALFSALSYRNEAGKSCLDPLKAGDYVSFANCYNGEGRDQEYGSNISQAAESYKVVTSDRRYSSS
jgi:peptidoglycan/xylan/chitin deacetylase (PgdA/CDA1 family)/3D (Asp-Asp-Asp) domain-containing protein